VRELILGGARSGKSQMAEQRAQDSGLELIYIATGHGGDSEMSARIAHHRERRGDEWTLVEEPINLAKVLAQQASMQRCLLVDCLTLWLSNCLLSDDENCWAQQREALLQLLPTLPGQLILVSNEVSMGLVAMERLSREFVDQSGWLHQALAQRCDRVTLSVAGLPHTLKGQLPSQP